MQNIKDSIWDLKQIGDADIPSSIDKVGVIGSGSIGPSIALLIAKRYIQSLLVDLVPVNLGQGTTAIIKELLNKLRQDVLTVEEMMQVQGRLNTSTVLSSLMDRNIIIEAIIENEEAKIELYNDLDSFVSVGTIICSNTNSINLEKLGSCLKNPENFAGFHFYPPLLHPNLVLIVRTKATSDECVAKLVAFAKKIKKTPIIINDSPGFLSNRLLLAWFRESQEMVIEGIDPYALDNAFRNAGFLFGLFEFMDLNGIDSCFYLNQSISEALVGDRFPVPIINKMLIEKGRLGVKSKVGYYKYNEENKSEPDPELIQMISPLQRAKLSLPDEDLVERLMLVAFIEANRIMSEKVVPTPGMLDLALNLTINFPNEWGGPFKWAEIQGWEKIILLIQKYSYLGLRFVPDAYLAEKISQKKSYYS